MKSAKLIADSGGTKTDWVLINEEQDLHYFSTESYHPLCVNDDWVLSQHEFWQKYLEQYVLEVHFFGSGCLKRDKQQQMIKAFNQWGISNVNVTSDSVAAFIATSGETNGYVAILGTGSVAAHVVNLKVEKVFGGLGYQLGDEGSGFYFGKLLIEKLITNQLSTLLQKQLFSILGPVEAIKEQLRSDDQRILFSKIPFLLKDIRSEELVQLHFENFELFALKCLPEFAEIKEIGIVGSYAYHHRQILNDALEKYGWKCTKIVERPIEELAKYFMKSAF